MGKSVNWGGNDYMYSQPSFTNNTLPLTQTPYSDYNNRMTVPFMNLPFFWWDDKYERNGVYTQDFLFMIQRISDYLLQSGSTIYDKDNKNTQDLYDRFNGVINKKDYYEADYAFGETGLTPIRDNHFFHNPYEKLSAKILGVPFEMNIKNISDDYTNRRIEENSKLAGSIIRDGMVDLLQKGTKSDLSYLRDKKAKIPETKDDLLSYLNGKEQYEMILYKLIEHINLQSNFKKNVDNRGFRDKFIINSEFAYIDTSGDDVVPMAISPNQVKWIATKPITTFEDSNVMAVTYINYKSLQEIIRDYGYRLNTGTGSQGLVKTVKELKAGSSMTYDPANYYLDGSITYNNVSGDSSFSTYETRWIEDFFYPMIQLQNAVSYNILEQKIYFKMLKKFKFIIKLNGKNPTKKDYDTWRNNPSVSKFQEEFIPIENDYKKKQDEIIVEIPKEELWEATRIGHNTLINVGKYTYSAGRQLTTSYTGFPIVAQISRDKSFVKLGEQTQILVNKLLRVVEEIINTAGFSSALMIDTAQGEDPLSFLYQARKVGIATYNSTRMQGGGNEMMRHLSMVQLGNQVAEVDNYLQLIGVLVKTYENMIGIFDQSNPYDSARETQLNVQQREMLSIQRFYEHNLFLNQVLQRTADVAKLFYKRKSKIRVVLSTGEVEVLDKLDELNNYDYNVYLYDGSDMQRKKELINKFAEMMAQSGGVEFFDLIMDIAWTDSPYEAKALLQKNKEKLMELQKQSNQATQQQNQQQSELEAYKAKIPLMQEELKIKGKLQEIQLKQQGQDKNNQFKGNMTDIKESNDREKMLLKSKLTQEEMNSPDLMQGHD